MTATAFVFRDQMTFWWPVTVRLPQDGDLIEASFEAQFKTLPEDQLVGTGLDDSDMSPSEAFAAMIGKDRERLKDVLIDWRGIAMEGGSPLPFTPEAVDQMLAQRAVRIGLGVAYGDAMLGQAKERAGN